MRPDATWTVRDLARWWGVKADACQCNLTDGGTLEEIRTEYDHLVAYAELEGWALALLWRTA